MGSALPRPQGLLKMEYVPRASSLFLSTSASNGTASSSGIGDAARLLPPFTI